MGVAASLEPIARLLLKRSLPPACPSLCHTCLITQHQQPLQLSIALNSMPPIAESVVAICAAGSPHRVSQSIVRIPTSADECTVGEVLGLISGGLIFSCAHVQDRWSLLPGEVDLYDVWCLNDATIPRGLLAGHYASTLGCMILAPDSMNVITSEDGGTESGFALLSEFEEKYGSDIRPTEIEFPEVTESAQIHGFFFGADGKTRHGTQFKIWKNSYQIEFYSNDFERGCPGGPIFTDQNQFIGVVTVACTHPDLNGLRHCLGVRIDQCMPRLLSRRIQWDSLVIQPETHQAPDPNDPWEQEQAAIDKLFASS